MFYLKYSSTLNLSFSNLYSLLIAEDGATLMLQAEALDRVLHIMRAFTNNAGAQS